MLCKYCNKGTLRTTVRCSFDMEFRKVKRITKKAIRSKDLELVYVSFTDYCPECGFHSLMDDAEIEYLKDLLNPLEVLEGDLTPLEQISRGLLTG